MELAREVDGHHRRRSAEKGWHDSTLLGKLLEDIDFDAAYTSDLRRTQRTLEALLEGKGKQKDLPRHAHQAVTERDYGIYTGLNKWEVKERVGDEEFNNLRRGWAYPVPEGENLRQVYDRVVPFFDTEMLPRLERGEDEQEMATVEMHFGELVIYHFPRETKKPTKKETRKADIVPPHA